jgi:hypothetical protein
MPETIEAIERRWSEAAKRPLTLAGLAAKWRRLARDLDNGYRLAIANYTNSLTIRGMLEEALTTLDDQDRKWLQDLVAPGDAAYLAATRPDPERLLARHFRHDNSWWWNRVPIKLGSLAGEYGIYPRGDPRRLC